MHRGSGGSAREPSAKVLVLLPDGQRCRRGLPLAGELLGREETLALTDQLLRNGD